METVSFYSYKGGVGRSLLVAHAARFLAMLGNRVVVADFDFEAPGLHYKFRVAAPFSGGVVSYLLATSDDASAPPALNAHVLDLDTARIAGEAEFETGPVWLMPAGPAPKPEYWADLQALGDRLPFGDPSGRGLLAVLDLHARLEQELEPDYLLIDARTGITELGSLAATVLSDTVVTMVTPTLESIEGTTVVIQALQSAKRLEGKGPIRVVPVLARVGKKFDPWVQTGLDGIREMCSTERLIRLPHDPKVLNSELMGWMGALPLAYTQLLQEIFPSRGTQMGQR